MRFKNPTEEEKKIDEAMNEHLDALSFEKYIFRTSVVLYFVGFPPFILGSGWIETTGLAITFGAIIAFVYHAILSASTRKKQRVAAELLQPYLKRRSLPLFRELQEKFADDPKIQFVHNDDGSVTINQKREDDDMRS